MATRFYFPLTEAAAVSPAIQGSYLHTDTVRRRLMTTLDGSTLTTQAYTPDAADHGVDGAAHHRQYVSDQIAAQNVSGTFKMQIQGLETHANNNLFVEVLIYVVSSDGGTIKETLFAQTRGNNELTTGLANRSLTGTLTAADLETNDRIVVELGVGGSPGGGGGVQGHNASLRWGSAGDPLPENDTETGTTFHPWIEFSQSLFAQTFTASFAATAVGVGTLAEATTFRRSFAATAIGVPALATKLIFKAAFAAAAVGVAAISTRFIAGAQFAATAVGVAAMTALARFKQAVAATVLGVAALATQFIPGGGGPAGYAGFGATLARAFKSWGRSGILRKR